MTTPNKQVNGRMVDLTGHRYGRWTVLSFTGTLTSRHNCKWLCRCDCGTERAVSSKNLRSDGSKSCGCLQAEIVKAGAKHGQSGSPEYRTFKAIRQRCENPNNPAWKHYGGRGIAVCERWKIWENFIADMGPRPSPEHSLDRINNDGPYAPHNCRWATREEQNNNKRAAKSIGQFSTDELLAELNRRLLIP